MPDVKPYAQWKSNPEVQVSILIISCKGLNERLLSLPEAQILAGYSDFGKCSIQRADTGRNWQLDIGNAC